METLTRADLDRLATAVESGDPVKINQEVYRITHQDDIAEFFARYRAECAERGICDCMSAYRGKHRPDCTHGLG